MSVSRVGGQTQAPAMKRLAETLKLEYAQFLELEVFTRFGAMVDERTRRTIEHGRRIRAILVQPEYQSYSLSQQVALFLAVDEGKLDGLPLGLVERFKSGVGAWLSEHRPRAIARIEDSGDLSDEDRQDLIGAIDGFLAEIAPRSREDG
jgi:F-type H+-transporting ATPase subunit alpha